MKTAEVATAEVPEDEVIAPGKIQINPNRISRVVLPVAGRIASVEVSLGDAVMQGQPLLRIESPESEDLVSQCLSAEAAISRATSALSKAEADYERISDLYENGAVAKKEVASAEAELARAKSELKEAQTASEQSRRRLGLLGLKPCEFGQQVVVYAPISGKVLEVNAVPGEFSNDTSAHLITIADLSTVWVTSEVPENAIRWINRGERVQIELAAYPGEVFQGRVMRVADTLDPQTRTVEVQTELVNREGRFRPEMFARIRHSHGTRKLPVVPASAVVQFGGNSWVLVERGLGEFERVRIQLGEMMGEVVPVFSGLEPGTKIVVDGSILLSGGGTT